MSFFRISLILALTLFVRDVKAQDTPGASSLTAIEHPFLVKYFPAYRFYLGSEGYMIESMRSGRKIIISGTPKQRDDIVCEFIHGVQARSETEKEEVFIVALLLSKGTAFDSAYMDEMRRNIKPLVFEGQVVLTFDRSIIGHEITFNRRNKAVNFRGYLLE